MSAPLGQWHSDNGNFVAARQTWCELTTARANQEKRGLFRVVSRHSRLLREGLVHGFMPLVTRQT